MLTLTNVRKSFGKTVAVDGLSLSVRKGELFGLLGPNGAGKSTTVSLAVGLLSPDAGGVAIEGLGNPIDPSVRQHIGVAPQAIALYDLLSGEENLRFFGQVYGLSGAALSARVAWCLDFVGLTDRKDDAIAKYSGGMKRRLNLAAALVHDPQLLLLDEPTVGVDPQSRNKIFENIEALHAEGRTIIYTTHYMEEAVRLCERIAIVDAGRLLALGTVTELLAKHGGPPTLVVSANGAERRVQTADPLAELNRIAGTTTIDAVPDGAADPRASVPHPDRTQPARLTMTRIIALALKDLRLMPRNKGGMFFTFAWPIVLMVLFGFAFGGRGDGDEPGKVRIAVVDEDGSPGSAAFLTKLEASFDLHADDPGRGRDRRAPAASAAATSSW